MYGTKKGKTKISKRGRSNLRNIVYQAAMVMVAKNHAFKEVYQHLTKRQENKLNCNFDNSEGAGAILY